jgi:hypothetical protein
MELDDQLAVRWCRRPTGSCSAFEFLGGVQSPLILYTM